MYSVRPCCNLVGQCDKLTIDEDTCASCLTCFRVCPLDAVEIGPGEPGMVANPVRCQACGVCAAVCPAGAITLSYWGSTDLKAQPFAAAPAVALVCRHVKDTPPAEGLIVRVPCLARLKAVDVLDLFRQGYGNVRLYPCAKEECKYGEAWENIQSLAEYVSGLLARVRPEVRIDLCLPQGVAKAGEETAGEL